MVKTIPYDRALDSPEGATRSLSNTTLTSLEQATADLSSSLAETFAVLHGTKTPLIFDVQDISFEALSNVGQFQEADKFRAENPEVGTFVEISDTATVKSKIDGSGFNFQIDRAENETNDQWGARVESLTENLSNVDGVESARPTKGQIVAQVVPGSQGYSYLSRQVA